MGRANNICFFFFFFKVPSEHRAKKNNDKWLNDKSEFKYIEINYKQIEEAERTEINFFNKYLGSKNKKKNRIKTINQSKNSNIN